MIDRQTNQSGSVVAFLVVGAVLASLLVGGIYFVNQRGNIARSGESGPVAVTSDKKTEGNGTKKETSPSSTPQPAKNDDAKKETTPSRSTTPAPTQSSTTPQASAPTQVPTTGRTAPVEVQGQLPVTGPMDTAAQVAAGAILLAGVIAYLKSYRYRFGSLFR